MDDYERGYNDGLERAARVAEEYYPSIIRCKETGKEEHVRMHVETQWCRAIAKEIRSKID